MSYLQAPTVEEQTAEAGDHAPGPHAPAAPPPRGPQTAPPGRSAAPQAAARDEAGTGDVIGVIGVWGCRVGGSAGGRASSGEGKAAREEEGWSTVCRRAIKTVVLRCEKALGSAGSASLLTPPPHTCCVSLAIPWLPTPTACRQPALTAPTPAACAPPPPSPQPAGASQPTGPR